jgi:hypothetical protein
MALQTQVIDIPIAGGLAENVDEQVIQPGSFATLHNVVYDKHGALVKRPGYGTLPNDLVGSGTLPEIEVLATRQRELLGIGEHTDSLPRLYSWSPTQEAWVAKDRPAVATAGRDAVARPSGGAAACHTARAAGHIVHTWRAQNAGLHCKIVDEETGAILQNDAEFAANGLLHVAFSCGDSVVIVYSTNNKIIAHRFDLPSGDEDSADINTFVGGFVFDACPIDDTQFLVAYWETATTDLVTAVFNVSDFSLDASAATTIVDASSISVAVNPSGVAVSYSEVAQDVYLVYLDLGLVNVFGPTLVVNVTGSEFLNAQLVGFRDEGNIVVLFGKAPTTPPAVAGVFSSEFTPLGVQLAGYRNSFAALIGSRTFTYNGLLYVMLVVNDGTLAMVCLDHVNHVTGASDPFLLCAYAGVREGYQLVQAHRCFVVAGSTSTEFFSAHLVRTSLAPELFVSLGVDLYRWDFEPKQAVMYQGTEVHECLAQTGGFGGWYDGQACVEMGFLAPPVITNHTVTAGTGNIAGEGTGSSDWAEYLYTTVFEWFDNQGNLHQSEPSPPYTVGVTAANNNATVDLDIACISHTRKGDGLGGSTRDVTISVYRTLKNTPEQFYRISTGLPGPTQNPVNDRVAATVAFSDDNADSSIESNGLGTLILSDQGGALENLTPYPPAALCLHRSRLWMVSAEDTKLIVASKLIVKEQAPGWHTGLSVRIDDAPDGATALASLDDKLVIFTPTRIYYLAGDGPNDTGGGPSFVGPFLVSSSAGCSDARSVVVFEGGILFLGEAGFYLLDRSLNLQYVGAPVEDEVERIDTVLGVVLDAARSRVVWQVLRTPIFVIIEGEGTFIRFPRYLVFDYEHRAWCTWSLGSSLRQNSHVLYQGEHVISDQDGVRLEAYGENPGWDPGPTWITSTVQTPVVKVGAIGGYQRCRRVQLTGRKLGHHSISVEIFPDWESVASQTNVFDIGPSSTLLGLPVLRLPVHVGRQKCSAISVRIEDSYDGEEYDGEAGFSLVGISLEVATKQGTAKTKQRST